MPTGIPTALPTPEPTPIGFDPSGISPNGPWLVYQTHSGDGHLRIVNQDGTGQTPMIEESYDPADPLAITDEGNLLAALGYGYPWLIRPREGVGFRLIPPWCGGGGVPCEGPSPWDVSYTGDESNGFLASIYRPNIYNPWDYGSMELLVHELPNGMLRARLPLVRCTEDAATCQAWEEKLAQHDAYVGGATQFKWLPEKRHLVLAALWDGPTTDLYIYDAVSGVVGRLTAGPSYIGKIFVSPGGRWIVFEAIPTIQDKDASKIEEGIWPEKWLWALRIDGSRALRLYSYPWWSGSGEWVVGWLDSERFISQNGFYPVDEPVGHLRLVDLASGNVKTLYNGGFADAELDPHSGKIVLFGQQGSYMISIADTEPRFLGNSRFRWDPDVIMFVSSEECEDDPSRVEAFTPEGERYCIETPRAALPDSVPSPDGHWQVVSRDGIWLKNGKGDPVCEVAKEERGQVIWRLDSQGFFLAANGTLSYVSVPGLSVSPVEGEVGDTIVYQWLGGEEP